MHPPSHIKAYLKIRGTGFRFHQHNTENNELISNPLVEIAAARISTQKRLAKIAEGWCGHIKALQTKALKVIVW